MTQEITDMIKIVSFTQTFIKPLEKKVPQYRSIASLQELVYSVNKSCRESCLEPNAAKTKYMAIKKPHYPKKTCSLMNKSSKKLEN